jgi:hypothetical protein
MQIWKDVDFFVGIFRIGSEKNMFCLMLLLTNVRKTDFVIMEAVHFRFNPATN